MKRSIERFLRQFRRKSEECTPAPLPTPEFDPATMDIAEVLRRPMRRSSTAIVQEFSDGTQKLFDPTRLAAADEIERLRKVVASPELGSVVNLVVDSSKIECGRISPIRSVVYGPSNFSRPKIHFLRGIRNEHASLRIRNRRSDRIPLWRAQRPFREGPVMSLKRDVRDAQLLLERATACFDRHRGAADRINAAIESTVTLLLTLSVASAASIMGLL